MTKIEWTGKTWNPIAGCDKISPGCANCYAIDMASRLELMASGLEDQGKNPGRVSAYKGLTHRVGGRNDWTGVVKFIPEALNIPLETKKPTTWFVNSMSDLFHESVLYEWLDQIFAVMALTPQHKYQILTKRAEMMEYLGSPSVGRRITKLMMEIDKPDGVYQHPPDWPLPNVWLGVTTENQKAVNDRLPYLKKTPAALRFLSVEPMLGPVVLNEDWSWVEHCDQPHEAEYGDDSRDVQVIRWLICGGESGGRARPFHLEWAVDLAEQCKAANVAFFFKQAGSNPYWQGEPFKMTGKGGNLDELPDELKGILVREMP